MLFGLFGSMSVMSNLTEREYNLIICRILFVRMRFILVPLAITRFSNQVDKVVYMIVKKERRKKQSL